MYKKTLLILISALILSGCGLLSGDQEQAPIPSDTSVETRQTEQADSSQAPDSQSYSLRLTSPLVGQVLKSPFLVGGEAALPNDKVYIRVKNTRGDVLISEETNIKTGASGVGPFSILINFQFQTTDQGTVEVFGRDQSGQEVELRVVEVNFDNTAQSNASI